jgi:hypothetical protein
VKFVDDDRWGEGRKLTVAGSVLGSPAYMSPEQGTGGPMNARSDVYSAGVVLYELLTGTWPYVAESRTEMLKLHLLQPVPALSAGRPGLRARPELDAVIEKAMAKEPDERFADAAQMLAALEAVPAPQAWLESEARPPAWSPAGVPPPTTMAAPAAMSAPAVMAAPPVPMPPPVAMAPPAAMAPPVAQPASSGNTKIAIVVVAALAGFCVLTGIVGVVVAVLAS